MMIPDIWKTYGLSVTNNQSFIADSPGILVTFIPASALVIAPGGNCNLGQTLLAATIPKIY